jgi:protein-L-isoaspartate(D-aspartate) O-methyltransferase
MSGFDMARYTNDLAAVHTILQRLSDARELRFMAMTLEMCRRFFAEEIGATSNIRNAAVIDALATVPREAFVHAGPWTVRGEADFFGPPRQTPDADPRHVYHNYSIAIDQARQLFNGAPGLLAMLIDRLELKPGDRAMHVGAGTGYYTAIMAQCVGPTGRVLAFEVDEALAAESRRNLASMPWVDVRHADGSGPIEERVNGILINAGITHPLDTWLDSLAEGGRMVLPLTVAMMGTIGKGLVVLATRTADGVSFDARVLGFVAIYSAAGIRDESIGQQLAMALRKNPFPQLKRLRRDTHDSCPACWLHGTGWCFSTE